MSKEELRLPQRLWEKGVCSYCASVVKKKIRNNESWGGGRGRRDFGNSKEKFERTSRNMPAGALSDSL